MNFGRVHGRVSAPRDCGEGAIRIEVMLETSARTVTVRDECVSLSSIGARETDPAWLADQLTQETIGVQLALDGWEAIAVSEGDPGRASVAAGTVTYVVRRM